MIKCKKSYIVKFLIFAVFPIFLIVGCTPNYMARGDRFFELNKHEQALDNYLKAKEYEPSYWFVYYRLGWTYYNLEQYDAAISQFTASLNLKEYQNTHKGLGETYYALQQYDKALSHFTKWRDLNPSDWLAYNRLGWTYYNFDLYDAAISQFTTSLGIKEFGSTYEGLGETYYSLQQYDKALSYFTKWRDFSPSDWRVYNRLGWTYYELMNYDAAITQLKVANNLKEDVGNFTGLGKSYMALGEYENAITALSNALNIAQVGDEKVTCKINLASCYVMQGKYQEAYDILGPKYYLGIEVIDGKDGIEINDVTKGSPANLAGLRSGDILTNFSGINLSGVTVKQFFEEIFQKMEFGSEVSLQIRREGENLKKNISIGITPYIAKIENEVKYKTDHVEKKESKTGMRWAVIIGISNYQDSRIPSLRYASADAASFYDWAISQSGGKYSPSRVKLLLDNNAKFKNIRDALFVWLKQALEEDTVTIYFAGHGSPDSPDSPNNLFLLPFDVQYNNIVTTGFPMWDIETALKRFIKAKKVIVIADACHSGGIGHSFDITRRANRDTTNNPISSGIQNLSHIGNGICVISASSDKQFSQESKKWGGGHGVFTFFLLKGLNGEADYNNDNIVTLGELIPYLSEQVRRTTSNAQCPTVAGKFDPALSIGR